MARELCRGYDLKFAQDAYVIVVVNGALMELSEVEQVISRGSRAQGIANGVIIMENTEVYAAEAAFEEVKARCDTKLHDCIENL